MAGVALESLSCMERCSESVVNALNMLLVPVAWRVVAQ